MNNAGPGPHSPFYYGTCYNAYAFPDNDGASKFFSLGYTNEDIEYVSVHRRIQACRPCRLHLPQRGHHFDTLPWYHFKLPLNTALAAPVSEMPLRISFS